MKVYVVLCETSVGSTVATNVDKVFLNEKKAERYADEQNEMYCNCYHWVEERRVDTDD